MSKGFQSTEADELKVQAIVRRLLPSARRKDSDAFADGVCKSIERYGEQLTSEAYGRIAADYPWVFQRHLDKMPSAMRQEFSDQACEFMAETLEEAGLRLEQHMRISDRGIALTHTAVAAIAATGFPRVDELGGNDSLAGMGIDRDPFMHPLSEFIDESTMNLWAAASFFISASQGWIDSDKDKSLDALSTAVATVAPTLDLKKLLYRARYDDRALLKLCELAHRGMEAKFNQAFDR